MQTPKRDGDGYLVDMGEWAPEVGRLMAEVQEIRTRHAEFLQILFQLNSHQPQ